MLPNAKRCNLRVVVITETDGRPMGTADSSMSVSRSMPRGTSQATEHLTLAKHLTAERKTEEFVTGKGVVIKWERIRRQNHFLDALYNACAAGHFSGAKLVEAPKPEKQRVSLAELARRAAGR